jgi:ABC-type sugar transport system substrate-binding protein
MVMVAPHRASVKTIPAWYTGAAMKKASWILAIVFGLAFIGATLMNATLVGRARAALASAYLGAPQSARGASAPASLKSERYHLVLLLPDTGDSFFNGLLDGAAKAAALTGAAVQVFRYPGADAGEAARYFEIALRAKVDGLIMYAPRDSHGPTLAELAAEASRNGVVFVPVGTDAPLARTGPSSAPAR